MRNEEMLLIPGPTPVADSIYDAMASETRGHTDPRFVAIYKNAIEQTRTMLQTDGEVFVVAGSGTIAMEMALVNTVVAGEKKYWSSVKAISAIALLHWDKLLALK